MWPWISWHVTLGVTITLPNPYLESTKVRDYRYIDIDFSLIVIVIYINTTSTTTTTATQQSVIIEKLKSMIQISQKRPKQHKQYDILVQFKLWVS